MKLLRFHLQSEVKEAAHFWEETLKVRATSTPIRLRRLCGSSKVNYKDQRAYCVEQCAPVTVCGEIIIPDKHLEVMMMMTVI
jgi:leishmanolysin-like peptidase